MAKKKLYKGNGWEFILAEEKEIPPVLLPLAQQMPKLRLEKRNGNKLVTIIAGLVLTKVEFNSLARKLKKACACGGSVVNSTIEIQGDKLYNLQKWFRENNWDKVKL